MIAKVVWNYRLPGGQTGMNVWHVQMLDGTDTAAWNAYIEWLITVAWPLLRPAITAAVRLVSIEIFRYLAGEYVPLTEAFVDDTGADTGDTIPPTVAYLAHQTTAGAGKKGSKYFPGGRENQWSGSAWGSTVLGYIGAHLAAMCAPLVIISGEGVSFRHGIMRQADSGLGLSFDQFNGGFVIDVEPGTQRRRRRGVGV